VGVGGVDGVAGKSTLRGDGEDKRSVWCGVPRAGNSVWGEEEARAAATSVLHDGEGRHWQGGSGGMRGKAGDMDDDGLGWRRGAGTRKYG